MKLSAPTQPIYLIAVILAILSLLGFLGVVTAIAGYAYWLMTIAFGILVVGCAMKGI